MSGDKLVVYENARYIQIGWYIKEDEDMGLMLGQLTAKDIKSSPLDIGVAEAEATLFFNENKRGGDVYREGGSVIGAFCFATRAIATRCLMRANAAIKAARANRPIEDWEKKAMDAGWKPPKGRF